MATYYVYSGAAGAGTGADWTNAFTTLSAASAATASDLINIASDHSETGTTALTFTFPTGPGLRIISVDRGTGAYTTGASIARGAGNVAIVLNGCVAMYGVTFLGATNNSASANIQFHALTTGGCDQRFFDCSFTLRSANTGAFTIIGNISASSDDMYFEFNGCAHTFGSTSQRIDVRGGRTEYNGMTLAGATAPGTLFYGAGIAGMVDVNASDLSGLSFTNLVGGIATPYRWTFSSCKFPTGITVLSSTVNTNGGPHVYTYDSAIGDVHGTIGFYSALGSAVSNTANYLTAGAAAKSFAITTSADVSRANPFKTPWIAKRRVAGGGAITPYIECLRNNGTASAYTDAQVWAEIQAKVTTGFAVASRYEDEDVPEGTGTAQAAGVGTGSWTIGSSNSPASFKCDSGSSLTPAEDGEIYGRIVVAVASLAGTLYVNPSIGV